MQEALLKAITHLDQLSDLAKFKGWLLQIATNEARLKRRVASLIALLQCRLNSGWLVLIGAIIGLMTSTFHIQL